MRLDGSKIDYLTEFKEERQRSQNYSNKRVDMQEIVSRALMMKQTQNKEQAYLTHMSERICVQADSYKISKVNKMNQ